MEKHDVLKLLGGEIETSCPISPQKRCKILHERLGNLIDKDELKDINMRELYLDIIKNHGMEFSITFRDDVYRTDPIEMKRYVVKKLSKLHMGIDKYFSNKYDMENMGKQIGDIILLGEWGEYNGRYHYHGKIEVFHSAVIDYLKPRFRRWFGRTRLSIIRDERRYNQYMIKSWSEFTGHINKNNNIERLTPMEMCDINVKTFRIIKIEQPHLPHWD